MMAHGLGMAAKATANFATQKGRVDENNSSAKKGKGSTKNEKKINTKRKESWSQKEKVARQKMTDARKSGATKSEKAAIQKEIDHTVNQQRTSENHARTKKR